MIARGRLDIRFPELFRAAWYVVENALGLNKKQARFPDKTLPCLSVRTGFDLLLSALKLERGTEILVANINIPDMFAIMAEHGLKAVPLKIDQNTLAISVAEMEAAITPKTKLLLITHLFGAVMNIEALLQIAKARGLTVIEDCAQAYDGIYSGNPQADVGMFSFGLIKTNTALTGALLHFNNQALFNGASALNHQLPVQPAKVYFKKILNATLIKLFTKRVPFSLAYWLCRHLNKDFDAWLSGFTRGFPGAALMRKIRHRPCAANLWMLHDKYSQDIGRQIKQRKALAAQLLQGLNKRYLIGAANVRHTHWVLPIEVPDPALFIEKLRGEGFDATSKASSLVKFNQENSILGTENELMLENLIYLPMDITMGKNKAKQLNQLLLAILPDL
ncbi:aminotransferase class V-fold PLP-dependent enzyme [Pedobacter nanyangensis]|uniref:aminotransferase class V-fold PLP-dependent enzyme n=1 Tax=Pedobacter nanyangensis TaxID=1562389 RepID=UPI000DE2D1F7|nr:aminotransferase class V-fold PLP-dependent enzyme [Pedobacter nanyangensis]